MPERLRIEALECYERLLAVNTTLTVAVDFYLKHAKPVGGKKSLTEVINELLASKRKAGKRESYVRVLGWTLRAFERDFHDRNVSDLQREAIEMWLDRTPGSLSTRRNRIRDLAILFEFSRRRGYCGSNPLDNIERPILDEKRPEIFTVTEAVALLNTADAYVELGLVPAVAIGLFAGLRLSEIKQLEWRHVDFEHNVIDVDGMIAKTRQQRNVEMLPALTAWLQHRRKFEGRVVPINFRGKMLKLRDLAGLKKGPDNGLRHSFGSYHVAHFQNPNLTALQMGHATTQMLFKHYRNYRINKSDAARYWNIMPSKAPEKKVVAFAAS